MTGALRALGVACVAVAFAFLYWWPTFASPEATGVHDWQFFHHMWEVARVTFGRYGELPLWNPFDCGGVTLFGGPQTQVYSPLFLLVAPAGTALGSRLFLVLHMAIGVSGMYVLARRTYGFDRVGAMLAAGLFGSCGFFAWHGILGHAAFLPFYFAPWVIVAWREAYRSVRGSFAVALILTLALLEGGVYPFPFFVILLFVDAVTRIPPRDEWKGVLGRVALAIALTGLLASIRLLPILETLRSYERPFLVPDSISLREALEMFTAREHDWKHPPHEYRWHEYGAFVGWLGVALGAIGALIALRRPYRHLLLGALVFFGLMMGDHGPYSPWGLLSRVPVYGSLRVPTRMSVLFVYYLALLSGLSIVWMRARLSQWLPVAPRLLAGTFAVLLSAAALYDVYAVTRPIVDQWHGPPIDRSSMPTERFHLARIRNYGWAMASLPHQNLGSVGCNDGIVWPVSRALWFGDVPQARVVAGRGSVETSRTPNRISVNARLETPARIVFNQNYAPGWESEVGVLVDDQGRLALDLPQIDREFTVSYRPPMLVPGVALSGAGLVLGGIVSFAPRVRRRRKEA